MLLAIACVGACASDGSQAEDTATTARTAARGQPPPAAESAKRPGARLSLLGRFDQPTYLAAPPGDTRRRFVVEREGRVVVLRGGRARPFLDIRSQVDSDGEGGLLSMAFAPDYASSRRFYVYYTDTRGYPTIAQYRRAAASAERAQPGSKRIVLSVEHHRFNHKGGQIQFGPDGKLYAAFGDGGGGGDPDRNAQNLARLLGKMIRIEPLADGRLPGARRQSAARASGRAAGDLRLRPAQPLPLLLRPRRRRPDDRRRRPGRRRGDRLRPRPFRRTMRPRGGENFGWSVFEGRSRYNGGRAPEHVAPVITHSHAAGWCSIIGGYVIRDRSLGRDLRGRYVYGDNCRSQLQLARLRRGGARTRGLGLKLPGLVSFGEDARGRVYAVSLNGGIYRIAPR